MLWIPLPVQVAGGDRSNRFWSTVPYSPSPTSFPEYRNEIFHPPFVFDTEHKPTITDCPSIIKYGECPCARQHFLFCQAFCRYGRVPIVGMRAWFQDCGKARYRAERKAWSPVGFVGQLVALGSHQVAQLAMVWSCARQLPDWFCSFCFYVWIWVVVFVNLNFCFYLWLCFCVWQSCGCKV